MTQPAAIRDPGEGSSSEPAWVRDGVARCVERYVVGPELGRGGMGRVHLGWDPMLRRQVAIKLLVGDDPEFQVRLLREARSQARLDHPNVCRIHDVGVAEDRPYIAMQLILGSNLSDLRPELGHRQMAALLAEVAGAVHAAHKAGLIHRDLKPANILVSGRGTGSLKPYVVDFGLARDLQALDQTLSWAVMGTPAFMSPEQARGEALGPATDIYSLGATLYAMLSGKPPYEGATLAGLITLQADQGVRAIRRLDRSVPKDLETITLKCLEMEPSKRYASALELEQDLRRWLAGEPIRARPVGPAGRLLRWSKRKPALAATAAAGLAVAVVLSGWNLRTARQAGIRERLAQRFALEIRDAEHLLRIERMMPVHDIRPAEGRLRGRMHEIEKEMNLQGGIARGPGLYAHGRGHLALRDYEEAIKDLDGAWNSGFQAPEVAYARALSRLKLYEERAMDAFTGSVLPDAMPKARAELVLPALRQLRDAKGARVDNPEYGYALAAWGSERFQEAEDAFRESLGQAPWLAEAWLGRFRNGLTWKWGKPMPADRFSAMCRELEAMLEEAERLAPSDEEPIQAHIRFKHMQYISLSARKDRSERPLAEAMELMERTRRIRPDSTDLVSLTLETAIQRGFLQLSTGKDPGPMMRDVVQLVEASLPRKDWYREQDRRLAHMGLHHACWIAGEADWRFGRDPRPALAKAAGTRKLFPTADSHFVFPEIILAKYRISRGEDPAPVFQAAQEILKSFPNGLDLFQRSILGELYLEWAGWLSDQGLPDGGRTAEAVALLERSAKEDPGFAYTWYSLPALHVLRARSVHAKGGDPAAHLKAALDAARRGVQANPGNAQIRLTAAQAHLAEAQFRSLRREDPTAALAEVRLQLQEAGKVNPKDFRQFLVRAEAEGIAAGHHLQAGGDASGEVDRMDRACRLGLQIKADEPRFHLLLAKAAALRADLQKKQGDSPEASIQDARRELGRILGICPNHKEAKELIRKLELARP